MTPPQAEPAYLRRPFLFVHLIWAVVGLAASAFLIVYGGEGHPPGIILLPVVWVVWALGHGGLWMVRRLAVRGRSRAVGSGGAVPSWPPGLILAAAGTGLTAAGGALLVLLTLVQWKEGRFLDLVWVTIVAVWLANGVCCAGLLLRRAWSGLYAALLCFGWAALLGAQIVDHLVRGSPIKEGELVIAIVLISVGVLFGWHLATSRRIKAFLSVPEGGPEVTRALSLL